MSKPLQACSLGDYVDDVRAVAETLGSAPVLIGHSMGCWVVLKYLAMHGVPAGVLMAPGTPQGLRRWAFRSFRRHPWLMLRANTFGNTVDLFATPTAAREFGFSAQTPDSTVRSTMASLEPESARAVRETVNRLPDACRVKAPMLVLAAEDDGMRIDGDARAVAHTYRAELEMISDMGPIMMLEPGWQGR